ncbi:MAG: acyl--CoA ligase, partial [Deltaproteobacteria bacterium]|nr:acyl--CoA ligase [Deltaproteobacteria bacterium]
MNSKELENKLDQMGLLVDQVKAWAETTPDKPFFYYGEEDRTLTYGEFNGLANCMANNFRSMGVGKGDRVSLFLKNPLVTTLSMYGLWKIGAVFCPINFLYQGRLLSYQINDTRPKLLITESGREPILNQIKSEIEDLPVVIHLPKRDEHDYREDEANLKLNASFKQTLLAELLSGDRSNPDVEVNYWDTANIVYTSGTTGPPKGVV